MAAAIVPTLAMSNCSLGGGRPTSSTLELLPARVLEEIFKHLTVPKLLEVRTICRFWKETIDGCRELMAKVLLKFPETLVFDRNFQPPVVAPARNARFEKCRISSVDLWWPPIGQNVLQLTVSDCQVSFSMLVKLLKHTPDLKTLEYLCSSYHVAVTEIGKFQLETLENLAINVPNDDILDVALKFKSFCPKLKSLKVSKDIAIQKVIERQDSLKDILEEIHLNSVDQLLDGSLQLNRLKGLQISTRVTNKKFQEVCEAFPGLQSLVVKTEQQTELKSLFLVKLENLNALYLSGRDANDCNEGHIEDISNYRYYTPIDFSDTHNPQLKQLSLVGIAPKPYTLQTYLTKSPKMRHLTLHFCWFTSWSEIFTMAESLNELVYLELTSIYVKNQLYNLCEYFDNLNYLKIKFCTLPEQLLITLFSLCPQLAEVYLRDVVGVTDEVIRELVKSSKTLRKLSIIKCCITDKSVECIAESRLSLQQLEVQCDNVSAAALNNMKVICKGK